MFLGRRGGSTRERERRLRVTGEGCHPGIGKDFLMDHFPSGAYPTKAALPHPPESDLGPSDAAATVRALPPDDRRGPIRTNLPGAPYPGSLPSGGFFGESRNTSQPAETALRTSGRHRIDVQALGTARAQTLGISIRLALMPICKPAIYEI